MYNQNHSKTTLSKHIHWFETSGWYYMDPLIVELLEEIMLCRCPEVVDWIHSTHCICVCYIAILLWLLSAVRWLCKDCIDYGNSPLICACKNKHFLYENTLYLCNISFYLKFYTVGVKFDSSCTTYYSGVVQDPLAYIFKILNELSAKFTMLFNSWPRDLSKLFALKSYC